MYVYIHVCIYAYMHICIHAYMHICIYACMYVCMYVYVKIQIIIMNNFHVLYIYVLPFGQNNNFHNIQLLMQYYLCMICDMNS